MLQPTMDKLNHLKLFGMIRALEDQLHQPEITGLSFEERLGLLVDREVDLRAENSSADCKKLNSNSRRV